MKLTFYYDYASPYAYLGSTQIERIAAEHGAELVWRPFLLGALFREIGTPTVPIFEMSAKKRAYVHKDMHRWADLHGVPFRFPSRFPMHTVAALRMTLASGGAPALAHALFRAYWVEDRDIADEAELAAIASGVGLDGAALVASCQDAAVKAQLREATDAAVALGVPGAPSFYLEGGDLPQGMLFWGQDRLAQVERVLGGWRPACG